MYKELVCDLVLPNPPSINRRLGFSKKTGRAFKATPSKSFDAQVLAILVEENLYNIKIKERISYEAYYYPPDERRRDIDNFCTKSVMDALTKGGLWEDDTQVDEVYYKRMLKLKGGKIQIKIYKIID